jgi:hypothetical protein
MLAHELIGLGYEGGRAGGISLNKFQAGEKHPTESECVNTFHLPRQLDALLPVLLGGIQVIPFVEYPGQAKTRFAGNRLRLISKQLQAAPVALGRQKELVF